VVSHPHLQQLRELDFTWCTVDLCTGPSLDFSPLMAASCSQHGLLHLNKLRLPAWYILCGHGYPRTPELEQAFDAACQQLVTSYSAQLTSLSLTVISVSSLTPWFRLLLAHCGRLESLSVVRRRLETHEQDPPMEVQLETPPGGPLLVLTRLRYLRFVSMTLNDASLLSVLSRCPELESHSFDLRQVTKAGQEAAFRCCPKLSLSAGQWEHDW
jgi:hypothetical protein